MAKKESIPKPPTQATPPVDEFVRRGITRPAVLVLLKERQSYGYELLERLAEIGLTQQDPGGLYRSLRMLEKEELVRSAWDFSSWGPPRRVYELTRRGEKVLEDLAPALAEQQRTISSLLRRYRDVGSGKPDKGKPRKHT